MSTDGLSARALSGATAAITDRPTATRGHPTRSRRSLLRLAAAGVMTVLALAACSSNNGGVAGATGTPLATTPAESASPSAEASANASANRALITFQEVNASKVFGGGVLSDLGDGSTAVTVGVVAIGFKDPLTAEIVAGDCENFPAGGTASVAPSAAPSAAESMAASEAPSTAASEAPSAGASAGPSVAPTPATLPVKLTDVNGGSSNTVVQIGLADLLGSTSAIVLHKSAADPTVVACADVTMTPAVAPSAGASEMPSEQPSSAPSASTAP